MAPLKPDPHGIKAALNKLKIGRNKASNTTRNRDGSETSSAQPSPGHICPSDGSLCLSDFKELVLRWYPLVRDAIAFYEVEEGRAAVEARKDLQEVFGDFWRAFQAESPDASRVQVGIAADRLRKLAIRPYIDAVAVRFGRYQEARYRIRGLRRLMWRIVFVPPPPGDVVDEREELIKVDLEKAYDLAESPATIEEGIRHAKEAHRQVERLEGLFEGREVGNRSFALGIAVLTLALGGISVALYAVAQFVGSVAALLGHSVIFFQPIPTPSPPPAPTPAIVPAPISALEEAISAILRT